MYHTLSRILLAVVLCMTFLCSCSFSRPSVRIIKSTQEEESYVINTETIVFKNLGEKEFEENLNNSLKEETNKIISDFCEKAKKEKSVYEKASLNLAQDIKYNEKNIISVVGEGRRFTSGVHPVLFRVVKNVNTKTNSEIKLSDLFSNDDYKGVINREMENIIDKNPEKYSDLWKKPEVLSMHQEFFYFSPEGIVIFYPPYELSYYAKGFVEFLIPYNTLSGYYSEEYKIF